MGKQAGFNVKVKINGTAFRVERVERDDTCADLEVGDSEDGVFEAHIGGRAVAKLTFQNATYDPDDNPFAAPFSLGARATPEIEIYWSGLADDFDDFPEVLITSGKVAADVANLEPCSFAAVSNGPYTLAGE